MRRSSILENRRKQVNPEIREAVDLSFQIVDRIHEILTEKGLKQKDLAMLLGKKVYLASFLPDSYPFALGLTNTKSADEIIAELERKIAVLTKYIRVVGESEQLVFAKVSPKRNKADYEEIREILAIYDI